MRISVVIPTKNEEVNISTLLGQLAEQDLALHEIIVADAASTDRTRTIATSAGALVVNGGLPGPGRNMGAEVATGDLFLFLDADCVFPQKDTLSQLVEEMQRRKLGIAGVQVRASDGDWTHRLAYGVYNLYTRVLARSFPHAVGLCMMATRRVHEAIGGFDETVTLAEDMDYAQRAGRVEKFGILTSQTVLTPVRRWRKEGWWTLVWKYLKTEVHMLVRGPVRGNIDYDFEYKT